jgi:hypothetical protein
MTWRERGKEIFYSFFPDRNKFIQDMENFRIQLYGEKLKIGFGLIFIIFSSLMLDNLFSQIPASPDWRFTMLFSVLFGFVIFGLTLTINGFTSNLANTDNFQREVRSKLNLLVASGIHIQENQATEYQHSTVTKNRKNLAELLVIGGFTLAIFTYIIWFIMIMREHSTDPLFITTSLLAIPSALVAVVTFMYVFMTRDLININQKLVENQRQPKFSLDYDYTGGNHFTRILYLWNTGDIAKNLRITFSANWEYQKPPINLLSMKQGSRLEIMEDMTIISGVGHILTITLDYENIFSQQFREVITISDEQITSLAAARIHNT